MRWLVHSDGFILHYVHSCIHFLDSKFSRWWQDVELATKTKQYRKYQCFTMQVVYRKCDIHLIRIWGIVEHHKFINRRNVIFFLVNKIFTFYIKGALNFNVQINDHKVKLNHCPHTLLFEVRWGCILILARMAATQTYSSTNHVTLTLLKIYNEPSIKCVHTLLGDC
jgi:hypothetical protein